MSHHDTHYDRDVIKHDPKEGFDPTEPHTQRIVTFVVGSVVLLLAVIFALQNYFVSEWGSAVEVRVLSAPPPEVRDLRSLENWRLTHYEFTTPEKKQVRLPVDRARELVLSEAKAGKTFYPAKPSTPKPEAPPAEAAKPAEEKK
ncbi:MAG: hypothetical protein RL328_1275 [Acidobacteriota bacterium]|jgi:hypothetical protein